MTTQIVSREAACEYCAYTKWSETLRMVLDAGFEILSIRRFLARTVDIRGPVHPSILIAAHRTKKLLLYANSYFCHCGTEVLNIGRVYGALDIGNATIHEYFEGVWGDVKDAYDNGGRPHQVELTFRSNSIRGLEQRFPYTDWNRPDRFLWLVDYVEEEDHTAYEKRRQEFLDTAPEWVKDFIY